LRILHVLATVDDPSAGPSYSVPALARAVLALGQDVELHTVAGWRSPSPLSTSFAPAFDPTRILRHEWSMSGVPVVSALCWSEPLRRALRREATRADVLHAHGLWLMPNVFPSWSVRRSGARARLVLSPRGMLGAAALGFSSRRKALFWQLLQKSALNEVHCFHATSESEAQEIRSAGLRAPIAVIANGIDVPAEEHLAADDRKGRVALSLGRIHPKKGLATLVRAWARLPHDRSPWTLKLVGPDEGGHAGELRQLAESLGVTNVRIEGPAFGDAKHRLLREADLFVLPTLNENFAMSVAEALAHGTPVISTKGAPWARLVENGCGWWIDQGEDAMVGALVHAMALPDAARRAMGERGRSWMERDFSWAAIGRGMEGVYNWLAGQGPRPATVVAD
jgi:glycosyltransferase involved in cell wall biosynthesis